MSEQARRRRAEEAVAFKAGRQLGFSRLQNGVVLVALANRGGEGWRSLGYGVCGCYREECRADRLQRVERDIMGEDDG